LEAPLAPSPRLLAISATNPLAVRSSEGTPALSPVPLSTLGPAARVTLSPLAEAVRDAGPLSLDEERLAAVRRLVARQGMSPLVVAEALRLLGAPTGGPVRTRT
jgi:hypothetical protein